MKASKVLLLLIMSATLAAIARGESEALGINSFEIKHEGSGCVYQISAEYREDPRNQFNFHQKVISGGQECPTPRFSIEFGYLDNDECFIQTKQDNSNLQKWICFVDLHLSDTTKQDYTYPMAIIIKKTSEATFLHLLPAVIEGERTFERFFNFRDSLMWISNLIEVHDKNGKSSLRMKAVINSFNGSKIDEKMFPYNHLLLRVGGKKISYAFEDVVVYLDSKRAEINLEAPIDATDPDNILPRESNWDVIWMVASHKGLISSKGQVLIKGTASKENDRDTGTEESKQYSILQIVISVAGIIFLFFCCVCSCIHSRELYRRKVILVGTNQNYRALMELHPFIPPPINPVSYTHLTLPTIYSV
eukprot:TRINITY_DN14090_c0_g1_i1.p1 TRINITY_DN14090_c0_g1~~TRINITY_DN14090_c0_g1_i1.p1  ORF type:complete len:362 (-),score=36.90 TRINITY_DN14090_c0_g1_i1:34-1119(-)